jgi:tRNA G18 (ribose-2'-O)-methylase SpoU
LEGRRKFFFIAVDLGPESLHESLAVTDYVEHDTRNVLDKFKGQSEEKINEVLDFFANGLVFAMCNIEGDFNFACLVRTANSFGVRDVYYVGTKRWDKRGAVGTHHYTRIHHLGTSDDDMADFLCDQNNAIAIENNIDRESFSIYDEPLVIDSTVVFGSESQGLSDLILDTVDSICHIPSRGSVRSLNVAVTSGIVASHYNAIHKDLMIW